MREIVSPLMGLRSPFGGRIDAYKAGGFRPPFVADFSTGYYRTDSARTTFADSITHTRAGNATMVDSDGVLKWAPHNLLTYSEQFDTGPWATNGTPTTTVTPNAYLAPDGTMTADVVTSGGINNYRVGSGVVSDGQTKAIWARTTSGTGQVTLLSHYSVGAALVTLTEEWQLITREADTTETAGTNFYAVDFRSGSTTLSEVVVWGAHLYRSDLGGMVNNPDRGDSYVPTTSAAVYLPRRGHHVWNGSAWVDEGILHESEARTNLVTYSQDFTDASWGKTNTTVVANAVVSPDGNTNASKITQTSGGDWRIIHNLSASVAPHTGSIWLKTVSGSGNIGIRIFDNTVGFTDVLCAVTEVWTRFSVTDVDGGAAANFYVDSRVAGSDLTEVYVYGAQLEAGSTPSSYIPTAGSTATRAAETLTIPAANLPWPSPVVIGEELVTNGTFDTDSDWTKGTGWTIGSGVATHAAGTGSDITQAGILVADKTYVLNFDVVAVRATSTIYVLARAASGNSYQTIETVVTTGTKTVTFVAPTTGDLAIRLGNVADADIDNISVREIDPLAVSIAMEGRMTYADTDVAIEVQWVKWEEDTNNRIITYLQTVSSNTGQPNFQQKQSGTADTISASNTYSPGVLVPFNIASRHGSTFINGAVSGTALTEDTTPVALPDLSATDLSLGYDLMGTIKTFRVWDKDIGDTGIAGAST